MLFMILVNPILYMFLCNTLIIYSSQQHYITTSTQGKKEVVEKQKSLEIVQTCHCMILVRRYVSNI